jgi:triacylglycerol lipase
MTIRSDNNDKFAQPEGTWIGQPGKPTGVAFDGPALKGAENVVIAGIDHRETAYSTPAFAAMFRFVTGRAPAATIVAEPATVVLDGIVSGAYTAPGANGAAPTFTATPTNLPLAGATVEVYATDPASGERRGAALLRKTVGADGRWGPLSTTPTTTLEFVLAAPGYATSHVYRSPFPRSSAIVHLRAERIADADKDAAAVVTMTRPRGYFGLPRDRIGLDGTSPPPGVPSGAAGVAAAKVKPAGAGRPVVGTFNAERIVGRSWPAQDNALSVLELTY